jgi:pre-mRNA-processing factor 39
LTAQFRLFERGAASVGLDFMAHPFWDKYIELEERLEQPERIFAILDRVIHIPMHQYARYFERYRQLAQHRPVEELLPPEVFAQFRSEIEAQLSGKARNEPEIERELRTMSDKFHLEVFHSTQTETTKRWTYEQEIKRPYFHVTELDESQLVNWRKYLDFEEVEGSYIRTVFLYERCLVTCAYYDEFWLRYSRWMSAQSGAEFPNKKEEEIRNIYQRASCIYAPISRPTIRLNWALFEEMNDRPDVSRAIYEAILDKTPGHMESIVSWASLERRQGGLDDAIAVYKSQIDSPTCDIQTKGEMVAEWAKLLWKVKGSADEARSVFQKNSHWYMNVRYFWITYFNFELEQPTSAETETTQYKRIKGVMDEIRRKSQLPLSTVKDLGHSYMEYLLQRWGKEAVKEYLELDREINGSVSFCLLYIRGLILTSD